MKKNIFVTICIFLISIYSDAQSLVQLAEERISQLELLIDEAESKNLDAHKEKMTVRTAEIFLEFAEWDENNIAWNTEAFLIVNRYKNNAAVMAEKLAEFERSEVVIMLDEAIDTLTKVIDGKIVRASIPTVDWSNVTHDGDQLTFDNKPVFLADYTWKPRVPKLTEFHGNQDGFYFDPNFVSNANGEIKPFRINELNSKPDGTIGFIFLGNKKAPLWAEDKYGPGFQMRENTYTGYDIDNPGAREMIGYLLKGTVPLMAGKKYTELGYMLCNEPHFYTTKSGTKLDWASGPVSEYSIDKFKVWLEQKYNSIGELNSLWQTGFTSFNDVSIAIPIDNSLQGTPKWYDWQTFNNLRVTEWYQWLKGAIREYDPSAKVHLKVMPNLWTENKRGHGLNMEDLNSLSDILGNDFGSENSYMWGGPKKWEENYSWEWRELCMGSDFFKSVGPDKIMYNTELHFLSKGSFRDLELDPAYVRATFWLAHIHGQNACQTWFWPREADGSPQLSKAMNENGYAGSLIHQPRVVNELHSTVMDLNAHSEYITAMQRQQKPLRIFYSETSALNKPKHMDNIFELYESLFFEGIPLGFATENIINTQDNSLWEAILVHQTEFVTADELAALQTYLDNGGTVLIDAVSFKKDEYGRNHSTGLQSSNGALINVNSLVAFKSQALNIVKDAGLLPEITITETNNGGAKGCTWRVIKNSDGNNVLSITNLGKTEASLKIELKDAKVGTACKDLLTGVPVSATPKLKPYEVYFVEVTDDEPLVSSTVAPEKTRDKIGKVYPNPTTGDFSVKLASHQNAVSIEVLNLNGNVLGQESYKDVDIIDYSLHGFAAGAYLVKLMHDSGAQSFLVQKL